VLNRVKALARLLGVDAELVIARQRK
jgi:hypothetical protein